LLNLNKQYLDHDTYTDIVTFDNSEADGVILGDIFISIDRIRENAITYQIEEADELHRVMVHGVLHLLGYGDKETGDKELMTSKEDKYLSRRNFTIGR
jgi:rRNA maturation RNase YbeY